MNTLSPLDQLSHPLVPAQNFNPSSSGCSGPWNHSTVRGLESVSTGSNACWIEEDREGLGAGSETGSERQAEKACKHVNNVFLKVDSTIQCGQNTFHEGTMDCWLVTGVVGGGLKLLFHFYKSKNLPRIFHISFVPQNNDSKEVAQLV